MALRAPLLQLPLRSHLALAPPRARLSLISRHLQQRPFIEINTPFSSERQASREDELPYAPLTRPPPTPAEPSKPDMSSQPEHPALLIPGPVEFDDEVLQSMSHYRYVAANGGSVGNLAHRSSSQSHVGAPFVATFGEALTMLRQLLQTTDSTSQPFVISGSGTLGWDFVAANLVEKGDSVLVLHTGYFADSFADCFETYGVHATQLKAPIGDRPQLPEVEKALKEKAYKLITVTHVDTSTGVLSEVKALSELVHRVSPDTLIVVDGVCSVGSEDIQFDDWGIDAVLTASQKAIGCPAGLCIMMYSGRAIEKVKNRTIPPASYFASIKNWLPSMSCPFPFPITPTLFEGGVGCLFYSQSCKITKRRKQATSPPPAPN